jgi:hypothetical protein
MSHPRQVKGLDPPLPFDLDRALKALRLHFGEVTVLTTTPHTDPATLERIARAAEDLTLWED